MESTFIILTQIITFGTAWSMFHCVLKRKKKDWFSLVGALGYLLLPYHVYDAFVPDLRGWYLPETMAISGDRNSGSCHGIPNLYDVETLAVRRGLCGERIGIYQHHGAGIQYRRSAQYLFL